MISTELVKLVYELLPGFLAAAIFLALTPFRKGDQFERIVQALIFTGIVKVAVFVLDRAFAWLGNIVIVGPWTDDVAFAWSIVVSIPIGASAAHASNLGLLHRWASRRGIATNQRSYPSEWYGAFHERDAYVVLHLADERRVYGWPYAYPNHPDFGHFILERPAWIDSEGGLVELPNTEKLLVPAGDVKLVEFIRPDPS